MESGFVLTYVDDVLVLLGHVFLSWNSLVTDSLMPL